MSGQQLVAVNIDPFMTQYNVSYIAYARVHSRAVSSSSRVLCNRKPIWKTQTLISLKHGITRTIFDDQDPV
jgi:hypothetical protein